jgi:Surface antigen variable number repeat
MLFCRNRRENSHRPNSVIVKPIQPKAVTELVPLSSSNGPDGLLRTHADWQLRLSCSIRAAISVLIWLLCTINCRADTMENPIILGLRIEGTQRPFQLETRIGEPLSREHVAKDLRRLWTSGWFDDIRIEIFDRNEPTTYPPAPKPRESSADPGSGESGGEGVRKVGLTDVAPLSVSRFPFHRWSEKRVHIRPNSQASIVGEVQGPGEGQPAEMQSPSRTDSSGVFVIFKLVERPHYLLRHVKFHPSSRQYPVEISSGTTVDKKLAHQVAARLQARLVDEGFRDAQVQTQIVPVNLHFADLKVRVQSGQRYRVTQVLFLGSPGFSEEELQRAVHQTRGPASALPGLGSLWRRWQSPPFSRHGVEANAQLLRSFYFSRGYWDNVVQLEGVEFNENEATVTFAVELGPRYTTTSAEISRNKTEIESVSPSSSDSATESLCRCLLKAQSKAEKAGNLDFAVQLEVRSIRKEEPDANPAQRGNARDHEPLAALKAKLETGPSYKVGRIDFQGNHNFGDLTLRRALLLNEGETFDSGKLRGSLSRLNQMGFFENLTQDQVRVVRDPARNQVDLTLDVKEKPRGRWALAGSAEPLSLLKPLQFSVGSRLPSWGSKTLELSTYFASMTVFPWSEPFAPPFLPSGNRWKPLLAVTRARLPGEEWRSGFAILPQEGWKGTLFNSGLMQAQRVASLFGDDSSTLPELPVAVWRVNHQGGPSAGEPRLVGSLLCEPSKSRFTWAKSASRTALDLALSIPRF